MVDSTNEELKRRASVIGPGDKRLSFIKDNKNLEAVISKVVRDPSGTKTATGGTSRGAAPSEHLMEMISDRTAYNTNEAYSMSQLQPEVELAEQILVSSILSPNDLTKQELNYNVEEGSMDSKLSQGMLDVVSKYFTKAYRIDQLLDTILGDCLFKTGSYPLLVLPESSIDRAINSNSRITTESLSDTLTSDLKPRGLGILGDPGKETASGAGLESLLSINEAPSGDTYSVESLGFDITDNPSVLKVPFVYDKMLQDKVATAYSYNQIGLESKAKKEISDKELVSSIYKKRRFGNVPILPIEEGTPEENIGHPLVMRLPSESVIPVHVPSNPDDHVGYFVLLDNLGNPITKALESDYYRNMQTNLRSMADQNSPEHTTLNQVMSQTYGQDSSRIKDPDEAALVETYTGLVEDELLKSLKNGVYGDTVEVSRPQEVYRIMFSRLLANLDTRVLYVPESLMTYFAFDFNSYGVGRSLLEKSRLIGSIRSVLLFANTMASIRSSVGRTRLNLQLDPEDPDPTRTVEYLVHQYLRTSKASMPLGESNPSDIVNWLQEASIDLQVEGNPRYPQTKLDVEDNARDVTRPDEDLEEKMRKRQIMAWGISPETIDMSTEADFATSIVNSNLLFSKKVLMYQNKFTAMLSSFVRCFVRNSGNLADKLSKVIEENKKNLTDKEKEKSHGEIINDFLEHLIVELPAPDSSSLENQFEAYEMYEQALDMALEAYFSPDFLTRNNMGDLSDSIDEVRMALKAHFLRRWQRNNNMMPELEDLVTFDETDGPALDLMSDQKEHILALAKSVEKYLKEINKAEKKRQERMNESEGDGETDSSDSSFGSSEEEDSGGGFGSSFGEDDTAEEEEDDSGGMGSFFDNF